MMVSACQSVRGCALQRRPIRWVMAEMGCRQITQGKIMGIRYYHPMRRYYQDATFRTPPTGQLQGEISSLR